jgi:PAS domain S-box-containing protein
VERLERVRISEGALARHGGAQRAGASSLRDVLVDDAYVPALLSGGTGFDVAVVNADELVGVVQAESTTPLDGGEYEITVVTLIANHLGAALADGERWEAERRKRRFLQSLFERSTVPLAVLGGTGEILHISDGFLAIGRLSREETAGCDLSLLFSDVDRPRLNPSYGSAMRGQRSQQVEVQVTARTGPPRRLALTTSSVTDDEGRVEGVLAILQDLTKLRDLEQQMVQAQKLATLGELAAGVVHELNNPLTSISVYSDYLVRKLEARSDSDPGDVEKLRRILGGAERMLRFARDLVAYARPAAGEPTLLAVRDVIEQSVMFCDHLIEETGADVSRHYHDQLPRVVGVRDQLHQVFINLITNACHAMPEGAGRLRIEVEPAEGATVRVRVVDNGAGIPPDHLERVFEPFFSTKKEGKGTGLGLSIVRNIVERHDGRISVTSEIGAGTAFIVDFPAGSE